MDEEIWTSLRKQVVRIAIEYMGWGCWDFIRYQLKEKVSRVQLHRYLHAVTKLATFRGLTGLHVDVEDLASYAMGELDRCNKMLGGRTMHQLLLPQFYWYRNWDEVSDRMIDTQVGYKMVRHFGLTRSEIGMAETFFTKMHPVKDVSVFTPHRINDDHVSPKDMVHFCSYTYENGHIGVYPLDTNEAGVLKLRPGGYDINSDYLTKCPEEEDPDNVEEQEEEEIDAEELQLSDPLLEQFQ